MYRLRSDGSLKTQGEIRQMYVNTSFPKVWSAELVESLGLDPVLESSMPDINRYQTASKDKVKEVDGKWYWDWTIKDLDDAAKAEIDNRAAQEVRATRDKRLAETDWVIVKSYEKNQEVPAEWLSYRQSLRDIPEQVGFPYEITWPVKP